MANKTIKTRQEAEDFVRGCTFYATGGGGLPENGIQSLMSEINNGREISWVDINEVPDDILVACPFLMGSIAPHTPDIIKEMESFGLNANTSENGEKERLAKAVQELEIYTNKKIGAVVPIELAGANTSGPISAGSSLGILSVDGDYCGRAIPEILQITPYLNGMNYLPITSVDEWGNVCIIKEGLSLKVAERVGKMISAAAYGLAGQAGFLMTGKELKKVIIPGTLTEAYELGKFIREEREKGENVVNKMVEKLDGWLLAKGEITKIDDYDKNGYYWGDIFIDGSGEFSEDFFRIWFKNENHVCWKNGEPYITSPDLICIVDLLTGEPIPNPKIMAGQKVAVIGVKAREQIRTEEAISVLGPRYFGFDIDYKPIEETLKKFNKVT